MFQTKFSEHNKIWRGTKNLVLNASKYCPYLRVWAEPSPESLPLGTFMFVQRGRHSETLYL